MVSVDRAQNQGPYSGAVSANQVKGDISLSGREQQLVRFGVMGQVRPFRGEGIAFSRGAEVVIRTGRGLEWGTVLTAPAPLETSADGIILRSLSANDRLLIARIEKNKIKAIQACEQRLDSSATAATLVDLELLFDGQTLVFYFLGQLDQTIERITAELAEIFETKVQFRRFTSNVLEGCGPDCGTDTANGGCSNCTTCAIASACGKSDPV